MNPLDQNLKKENSYIVFFFKFVDVKNKIEQLIHYKRILKNNNLVKEKFVFGPNIQI